MQRTTFWSHFEEPIGQPLLDASSSGKTKTAQREQPDQRATYLSGGTKTVTASREEDDQDPRHNGFSAVPVSLAAKTKTLTEQREEPDQDRSARSSAAIPALADHGS